MKETLLIETKKPERLIYEYECFGYEVENNQVVDYIHTENKITNYKYKNGDFAGQKNRI